MGHVLLVDDDLNFRRSLLINIELEGYKVTDVASPLQALSVLDRCKKYNIMPDVVITDVKMPEMDGKKFIFELKKKYPELPVIVISAFEIPEVLIEYPFFKKPFNTQEMIKVLKNI